MRLLSHVLCCRTRSSRRHGSFLFVWVFFGLAQILGLPLSIQEARAAVDLVGSWTGETQFETNGFNYTPGAGSNRIALIMITSESNTNPVANINSVTLGGQTLTAIQNADGVVVGSAGAFHNILWLGYLDETGIGNMVGNALSITWDQAPNNPDGGETMVQAATYQSVDQTTPVADSASNTNTSASTIQAGSVSVGSCDRLVYVTTFGTPADHTAPSGYTEQIEQDDLSYSSASAQRDATTSSTENPTATWSTTQRLAIITAVLNCDKVLSLADHTVSQESNAFGGSGGETNAELFAFELEPECVTVSVTQLVFTLSDVAALTDGDWGSVEIIVDSNNDGNIGVGETTTVGGTGVVNTAAGTITFSTAISVTAATSYILRADFLTLTQCDAVKISLTTANVTTSADKSGTTTPVTHAEAGVVANLVAHWKLDDGAGGTTEDSAGTNDGTITNATWTDGRLCGALEFDGTGDYVTITGLLGQPANITLTVWARLDSGASSKEVISLGDYVAMRMDEGGGVGTKGFFYNGSAWAVLGTSDFHADTGWHHLAYVVDDDNNSQKFYVDGVEEGTGSDTSSISYSGLGSNTFIGRHGNGQTSFDFDGAIDDVRVYDRALGVTDIQALAATYKVIDLGTLSEERSYGFSINDSEQIAGYDENATTGNTSAWLCETCSFTSIGTFAGGSVNESLGINDSGEVVGWSDNAGGDRKAFFYDGSLTDLGTLTDRSDSEAVAVNASSEVVGTAHNFGAPPADRLAFIYLPAPAYTLGAGINSLGTLGGHQSVAMDINDSGQVVGGAQNATNFMRPFRWANDVMTDLGTLGGEDSSILHRAQAINSSGDIVGMSYTAGGDGHAFLYDGSMTDLGVLTGGDTSVAYDINDDDQVVGTSNVTGGAFHAFIYQNGTMTDLNDLIDTNSTWTLIRATGINDDGEIVGWGQNPSSDYHAFLLIQTCSGSGPPGGIAGFEILLASSSGLTDSNGDFAETGVGSQGEPLAEIAVSDADPDKYFTFTVAGPGPDSTGAPGPAPGTTAGFAESMALPRTVVVESSEATGSFNLTVSMSYDDDELADWGIVPADVELHVLDTTQGPPPGVWVPAGTCLGESPPTGVIGDSGFVVHADGSVDFWAVRDAPGVFAVGAKARQNTADPMSEDPDATPPPRLCGAGIMQTGLIGLVVLMAMTQLWRRRL